MQFEILPLMAATQTCAQLPLSRNYQSSVKNNKRFYLSTKRGSNIKNGTKIECLQSFQSTSMYKNGHIQA